jgi:arylsulfatase A-like enzyme
MITFPCEGTRAIWRKKGVSQAGCLTHDALVLSSNIPCLEDRLRLLDHIRFSVSGSVAVGAVIGAQEGIFYLLNRPQTLIATPTFGARQEIQVLLAPILVYAVALAVAGLLWGLVVGLMKPRSFWPGDLASVRAFHWGWWAFAGLGSYLVLSLDRPIVLRALLLPPVLFLVGRVLVLSLLAGLGTAFFVIRRSRVGMWGRTARALVAAFSASISSLLLALWLGRLAHAPLAASVGLFVCLEMLLLLLLWLTLSRRRLVGGAVSALLPLAVLVVGWLWGRPGPAPADSLGHLAGGLRVILITVDTLRADRLPPYGYPGVTTPAVDRLSAEGVTFERARAQAPWTLPSFCSMFTSLNPSTIGVRSGADRLDDAAATMAEYLKDAGYVTQAIVTNAWLMRPFNLHQGFRGYYHFDEREVASYQLSQMAWYRVAVRAGLTPTWQGMARTGAEPITDEAIRWLVSNRDARFFLWLHYMDPHEPYEPPPQYIPVSSEPYLGVYRWNSGYLERTKQRSLTPSDIHQFQRLYDGEIQYVDHNLGRLLEALDFLQLTDSTLVLFTSDHGEEFLEHGDLGHGRTVYGEQLHVPLILRCPSLLPAGTRVPDCVRLIDVLPTVLDLLDIEPVRLLQGESLVSLANAPGAGSRDSYAEANRSFNSQISLERGRYKIISDQLLGGVQVFDLAEDPTEQEDLSRSRPSVTAELSDELRTAEMQNASVSARLPRSILGGRVVVDEFLRTRLKALGYVR